MQQPRPVGGAHPDREHAHRRRLREAGADADGHGLDAVQVPVEGGEVLAEPLGQPVVSVRAARGVHRDERAGLDRSGRGARGEAHGVVAGGEHDAAHALFADGLVKVVRALDVGAQDLLERGLQRDPREVHDRVHTAYGLAQLLLVGEVGGDDVLSASARVPARIPALDGAHVEEPERVPVRGQRLAHQRAQTAGGAGEQDGAGSGHGRSPPSGAIAWT